jgi:5-methyltetrahydrofolate--homocysteine methyltransferase
MLIIGERINSSRKSIARAISEKDKAFIQNEAKIQIEAGADFIDVNAGQFAGKETEYLSWLVEIVQEVSTIPLCLDSADPEAVKAVLPLVQKTPMINSISLEKERFDGLLPLLLEKKCNVVALCQSDGKMAHSASEKFELAGELIENLTRAGHPIDRIFIDPLVFPLATDTASGKATLDAISSIMGAYPGVHTICGLTNVSFGLPERKLINRIFLASAINMGLDAAIIDPTDKYLFAALKAGLLITGQDEYARNYIGAFRQGRLI